MKTVLANVRAKVSALALAGTLAMFGYGGCTIDSPYLVQDLVGGVAVYDTLLVPGYPVDEVVDVVYDEPYYVDDYYDGYVDDYGDGFGFDFGFDSFSF